MDEFGIDNVAEDTGTATSSIARPVANSAANATSHEVASAAVAEAKQEASSALGEVGGSVDAVDSESASKRVAVARPTKAEKKRQAKEAADQRRKAPTDNEAQEKILLLGKQLLSV